MSFTFPIRAVEIVDGDTLRCLVDLGFFIHYRAEVRLAEIDTPERNTFEGMIVKAYVEKWLSKGPNFLISQKLDREKFGRVLGDIADEKGKFGLAEQLLAYGLARRYLGELKRPWTEGELAHIRTANVTFDLKVEPPKPKPVRRPRKTT